jgi:ATP-binding cassette, subfamily F, member 3
VLGLFQESFEEEMSILSAEHIGLSFGAFDLFRGIQLNIANESKIGLIGPNGVGKTSLLLILAGLNQPTTGKVTLARGRRIGYLRQEAVDAFADRDQTVYAEMLTAFADLLAQQARLNEMEAAMSTENFSDALLEEYGRLQEAFEQQDGYAYDLRIQQTLEGLGLGKDYWHTPLNHLSGGQKTRALLARLLLEKPDLLMLDEPTNHLDIQAVEWLERTLRDWNGAVLIVSHDRYFLDNTVNTIWEMTPNGLETYPGGYSAYLLQRQERWDYQERVFNEEKARLLKEVDFIQRNWVRASTHARAMGRLRQLSRDLAVIDTFGMLALRSGKSWSEMELSVERPLEMVEAIRKVNSLSLANSRPPRIKPRLTAHQTSGTIVLRAKDATIGYPGHVLFHTPDLELRRNECAALIGANGSGKTTFLKALVGQVEPLNGSLHCGAGIKIGYFAQAQEFSDAQMSVLDELLRHKSIQADQARSYLAQYLFRGEDVFKTVGQLSGGERARLALAILALDGANFLMLDEPTNHLDIPAREALQTVLENFSGTILLVSHDRYLIDRLATQIWELRDGQLQVFKGAYREYLLSHAASAPGAQSRQVLLPSKALLRGDDRETRRRIQNIEMLEERIREQETALQRLTKQMQKAGETQEFERVNQLGWQVAKAQAALEELMVEWEKVAV